MPNLRASLAVTFFSSNGVTAVQFFVTLVLARLLSPAEIGIYSIAAIFVSFAHLFRDFGVASYLQREKDLTPDKVASAFGILLVSSWTIAASMFFASVWVARFYGRPEVQDIMKVLAIGFVFIPFGAITHVLLTRDYKAKEQALATAIATFVYAATAITLAALGFSYMAMAWASVANIVAGALAYIPFRPANAPWRPSLRRWREIISFGSASIVSNGLTVVNASISDLFLGRYGTAHDVGIMSRSISTPSIINQVLGPTISYAILPFLAKKYHAGHPLTEPLTTGASYLTAIIWPALALTFFCAEPIILILYGSKWIECVEPVRWMCLMFAVYTPFTFVGSAYTAIGRPYLDAVSTGLTLIFRLAAIYFLYDGTLASFAMAFVFTGVLIVPIQLFMQARYLGYQVCAALQAMQKSLAITLAASIPAALSFYFLGRYPALSQLLFAIVFGLPVWLACIWCLDHPLKKELALAAGKVPWLGKSLG